MQPQSSLTVKTLVAHERLNEAYGIQAIYGYSDPMHELIGTILSHRTTHANEVTAYRTMRERFPTWEQVRDAPLPDLIDAIQTANYPEVKAPYIQQLLTRLFEERGQANIDFLRDLSTEEAMSWLTSLPGIGLKTSTLLLLFTFHKPVLPVDTHVHRVTQRIGLIGPKVSAEKAHSILLSHLPEDAVVLFNFHKHFYWHGQRVCTWHQPKCSACVLRDICDFYQSGKTTPLSSTPVRRQKPAIS
ncbi:endonuclease III [Spirosoma sp. BT702]|uniref:Endonuclease III n=1 Tax=Spirosoma profusum TaxID=2771354 RepID=A0A926Y2V4_9BACT|nr:endonuclease III [Spirosoma profusum]MBD2702828.1 endonuclease III [Spirosoma profusum]